MNNNKKLFEIMMTLPEIKKLVSQIGPIINLDALEDKDKLQKIIKQMVEPDNIWLLFCAVLDSSGGTKEIIRKYFYLIKRRYVNQIINQELNNIFKADK